MDIKASDIKALRDMTGAGMLDCKKALTETNGDMDKAIDYLREKGISKAAKKQDRIAAEGLSAIYEEGNKAVILEVNSETDFVAKNETFQSFVKAVAAQAVNSDAKDMDAFMAEAWNEDASKTVNDALVEKVAVIGENLKIRRFEKVVAEHGCVVSYVHGGGRIGVIVDADTDVVNDAVKEAMVNIAMQIAALNPKYVSRDPFSSDHERSERVPETGESDQRYDRRTYQQRVKRSMLSRSGIRKS